ncbi:MAG: hypothetical protein ACYDC3_18245 [Candidatus Binataceae bacterium]
MPTAKKPPASRKLPAFFHRMPPLAQRAYLRSDSIGKFDFEPTASARAAVAALTRALESDGPAAIALATRVVAIEVCRMAAVMPLAVEVRSVRSRNQRGELHGLFYPFDARSRTPPHIVLWMRTAQRHDVVRPRTFVRTLMHELVHYLDYALLRLGDSYHTMGFFRRESFLVRMLLSPEDRDPEAPDDGDPPS